uniref:Phage protein n=1 Tax=Pseudomonas phage Lepni01 TaxID=3138536 RepID=A0AAU6W352_9VIRU
MLKQVQHFIHNPDDIPDIPQASADYLNVRLNATYLIATGAVDELRKAGFSEGYIMGFIDGCNAATEIVELMQEAQLNKEE